MSTAECVHTSWPATDEVTFMCKAIVALWIERRGWGINGDLHTM